MPIANIARHSVTTPSVPPTPSLITAGSSDSTTAPTSQNHDTITMPSHSRGSDQMTSAAEPSRSRDCG